MPRTRATGVRGEAAPEVRVEAPTRGIGRAPARVELERSLLNYKLRLPSTRFLLEFTTPLFQDTLLRMLGVLENFSQGGTTGTPHNSRTRVGVQTPELAASGSSYP